MLIRLLVDPQTRYDHDKTLGLNLMDPNPYPLCHFYCFDFILGLLYILCLRSLEVVESVTGIFAFV